MTRTRDVAGNSFNSALNLGTFRSKTRSITDTVGRSDSNDYFRVKVASTSALVISLTRLSADVDLEVYYESSSRRVVALSNSGTNNEVAVDAAAPSGVYYIRALPATSREAEYTLTVHSVTLPRSNRTSRQARLARNERFHAMHNGRKPPEKNPRSLWA